MSHATLRLLFFFLILTVATSAHCQNKKLPKNTAFPELYDTIVKQKFSNPEAARINAELLLKKSTSENNLEFIFKAYYQLARIANIQGNYTQGLQFAQKAEAVSKRTQNKIFICKALLTVGNTYVYLGDDDTSLKYYLEALQFAKESEHVACQIMAQGNVAKIKRNVHLLEEALKMYRENFILCQQHGLLGETLGINTYLGLTGTFLNSSQPDSTLVYAQPGLHYAIANQDDEGQSYFYIDMGIAHFMKSEFETAINYLKQAETITLQLQNKKRLVEVYYYLGKSYAGLENYVKAIEFLELTKETVSSENQNKNALKFNPHILLKTYEALAEIYKKLGNFEQSNVNYEAYKALDKLKDLDRTNVYETLLDNVHKENKQLSSSQSRLQDTVKLISIAAGIILLLCLYFIWRFMSVRKKNKIIFEQLLEKLERESQEKKKPDVVIQDEKVQEILLRLDKLEASQFYLHSNCSLQNVAKKLKTNTSYLSKIIGTHKQKKFTEYINELRIQYVLKRLKEDAKFRKYSIKNIAEEIGYKSTNSFTKHFKAHTKLYPSFYIQTLNEKEREANSNL